MDSSKVALVVVLSVLALLGLGFFSYIGTTNSEVRLRNQVEAQQQVLESHHDKMWKILQQKAGVASEYKDTFAEVYPDLISGRYDGEGGAKMVLAKMVKEDNPDFDTSLYKELSRAIEAHRTSFHHEQTKLLDLHREHKDLLQTFPGNTMLAGREPVDITIITSSRSKQAIETGVGKGTA